MGIVFEPGAMEAGHGADTQDISKEAVLLIVPLTSIAISLKRIADAMQSPNEYGEVGGAAIAGAISRSLRDSRG